MKNRTANPIKIALLENELCDLSDLQAACPHPEWIEGCATDTGYDVIYRACTQCSLVRSGCEVRIRR